MLCGLSVGVLRRVLGLSGLAAVALHGQPGLQVLDNALQTLASFPLLLQLLSELLAVGFRLLQLHVQFFDLQTRRTRLDDDLCSIRRQNKGTVSEGARSPEQSI